MDKNAIKKFAVWARRELIERVAQRAARFGIEENKPVDEKARVIGGGVLSDDEFEQRRMLIVHIRRDGYKQVMEEVAYTWFNRFIALRFMEVNGYLPSYVRVFSNESGAFDPQILAEALHAELYGLDMEKVFELEENDKKEELFKYLLITQCNDMARMLPGLFETIADYTELLFPDNLLRAGSVIEQMVTTIPEADWKDAVQIIGWLYQYYNTEPKDEVFAGLKKNIKISKEKIPAATQLFTPDWIVRYMVENSLGRLWVEGHPDDAMKAGWKYYLEEAPQEPEVEAQLAAIRAEYAKLDPAQILCCDPCMGSGHILVYMFDVLMQIYLSYGYTTNEAVESIVRNNMWGMDIDDRAAQLAYFAVMMKAQQYDNRWLAKQLRRSMQPNVFALQDSPEVDAPLLSLLGDQQDVAERVLDAFRDAKEYGSIIQPTVTVEELYALSERLDAVLRDSETQRADVQADARALFDALWPQIRQCRALVQKYHVVVTNPPYMGSYNMGIKLSNFIKNNYAEYKSDFFSAFIICGSKMARQDGYCAFFTPYVWMFIQSYEKLRKYLYDKCDIETLIQFEYSAFEEATVPVCTFAFSNSHTRNKKSSYIRLTDFRGGMEVQRIKTLEAISNHNCGFYYEQSSDTFSKIPGAPVAYWLSDTMLGNFSTSRLLGSFAYPKQGLATADNKRFLRLWFEVVYNRIAMKRGDSFDSYKWYLLNKGGAYRKWYGNQEYIINWEDNGHELKSFTGAVIRNPDLYFKEGVSHSDISSAVFSARYYDDRFIFDHVGPTLFFSNHRELLSCMGFMNSVVALAYLKALCPTIHFSQSDVAKLPIFDIPNESTVIQLVEGCIQLCSEDWDCFETSWDFQRHPLVHWCDKVRQTMQAGLDVLGPLAKGAVPPVLLALCYEGWKAECEERFQQLKANEEELNRIFIDIYGLQDELTPEVEDKDVTMRRADLGRDIRSLISYAVGCMFGRYSTDEPGLIFAGGNFGDYYETLNEPVGEYLDRVLTVEHDKVTVDVTTKTECGLLNHSGKQIKLVFPPDVDGIIPITDDEYFNDDIVSMFVRWLERVFGRETLEENLKFIADALGGKGTPRDVIRQYFLNDFFKDHLKVYQKRPIYWLFDSGKKNGFKCLIYMHRYQPDTLARIRTDYLHELQGRYRNAIETLERQIAGATTSERVKLQKRLTALKAQAEEARVYEEKIHHLADQMIKIDLDDGVKHNYAIFKDVMAPIK